MFSLMLMTAVVSGPDTTGFGFRSAGCYGSCYGSTVSASCYGSSCYGSSCYGSSCYGSSCYGSSCYGSCTGSSCYGSSCQGSQAGLFARLCARIQSRRATRVAYASCLGSSCYGSSCHGSSCYGSSCYGSSCYGSCTGSSCHGSSCYGSSCYGSCTGSSCYGSGYGYLPTYTGNSCYGSSCYGSGCIGGPATIYEGAPIYNGTVVPGTISGGDMPAVEVPTANIEEQPIIETTSAKISVNAEAAPAVLTITVPADAKLYVDGQLTIGEGTTRQFHTPNLQPGQTYYYEMKAEVEVDGDIKSQTKRVLVESGATLTESFDELQEPETMSVSTK